jgi:uncharacterized protein YbaR (Trm112 family)
MISEELLTILRCPHCVSGATRRAGEDPGRLELVHDCWLVCQESDCGRKYPIVDDIPIMLVERAARFSGLRAAMAGAERQAGRFAQRVPGVGGRLPVPPVFA